MPDLLKIGATWLARMQKENAAQWFTYQRGNSSIRIRATLGRSVFDETDSAGLITRVESQDFIVQVPDLEIDGLATEPAKSDRIIDAAGNQFDVRPVGNEPCFRYTDEHRIQFRVHTKKVGETP